MEEVPLLSEILSSPLTRCSVERDKLVHKKVTVKGIGLECTSCQ